MHVSTSAVASLRYWEAKSNPYWPARIMHEDHNCSTSPVAQHSIVALNIYIYVQSWTTAYSRIHVFTRHSKSKPCTCASYHAHIDHHVLGAEPRHRRLDAKKPTNRQHFAMIRLDLIDQATRVLTTSGKHGWKR